MISVDWIIFLKLMMNDEEWDKIGFWGSLLIIYICMFVMLVGEQL